MRESSSPWPVIRLPDRLDELDASLPPSSFKCTFLHPGWYNTEENGGQDNPTMTLALEGSLLFPASELCTTYVGLAKEAWKSGRRQRVATRVTSPDDRWTPFSNPKLNAFFLRLQHRRYTVHEHVAY